MSTASGQSPLHRLLLTLLLAGLCYYSPPAFAGIRCATVDIEYLLTNYHKAQQQSMALTSGQKKHEENLVTIAQRRAELRDAIKEMGGKILKLQSPPGEDSEIRKEYNQLVSQYQSLGKDLKEVEENYKKAVKMNLAISAPKSLSEIQSAIHQYARDHGYHWIIETSGTSNTRVSPLIYARNAPDISKEILLIINKDAPNQNKGHQTGNAGQKEDNTPTTP